MALPALLDQLRARREAQLVRERRDLAQLLLAAAGEQRHLAEQLELCVLPQPHVSILARAYLNLKSANWTLPSTNFSSSLRQPVQPFSVFHVYWYLFVPAS